MAHVLVVDDEEPLRTMLRRIFEYEGYDVVEAEDGQVGLDILQSSQESMIVMLDYLMPRRNGGEVLCEVAANPDLRNGHAFLMLTAQQGSITGEQQQAMETLHVPVISKPFDLHVLIDTVAQAAGSLADAN